MIKIGIYSVRAMLNRFRVDTGSEQLTYEFLDFLKPRIELFKVQDTGLSAHEVPATWEEFLATFSSTAPSAAPGGEISKEQNK